MTRRSIALMWRRRRITARPSCRRDRASRGTRRRSSKQSSSSSAGSSVASAHPIFYSLADVNAAIGELLARLNEERPIRRLGLTRRQLLEEIDRPAFKPLPTSPDVLAEWQIRRVSLDCHVEVEKHIHRPASLRAYRGRGAVHRPHRRDLPQGRADRRASAHEWQSQTHHGAGAHGLKPSALHRLDNRAHPPRHCRDRAGDQRGVRRRTRSDRDGSHAAPSVG